LYGRLVIDFDENQARAEFWRNVTAPSRREDQQVEGVDPVDGGFEAEFAARVLDLIDLFTPQECANYFAAAGYDPD
jgi:hypothetical protein